MAMGSALLQYRNIWYESFAIPIPSAFLIEACLVRIVFISKARQIGVGFDSVDKIWL